MFLFLPILTIVLFFLFSISEAENPIDNDFDAGNVGETTVTMFTFAENEQSTTTIGRALIGCSQQDHRSCDDVCKGDSFWYGFCASWDGRDFQCSCIAYKEPLDGVICGTERQEKCANECREKGQEAGGYCAVFQSNDDSRGEPKCMCFEKPTLNSNDK